MLWLGVLLLVALLSDLIFSISLLPAAEFLDRGCIGGCTPLSTGSSFHLLGTDSLGRDVLAQLIGGSRTALLGGIAASGLAWLIGYMIGAGAAWLERGGRRLSWWVLAQALVVMLVWSYVWLYFPKQMVWAWLFAIVVAGVVGLQVYNSDRSNGWSPVAAVLLLAEVVSSVPALLLLLALAALAFRPGLPQLILVYVFVRWTRFAVLSLRETQAALTSPYVQVAFHAGVAKRRLVFLHMLANTFGPMRSQLLLGVATFVVIEGTFAYLGLGLPAEQASWGRVLAEARQVYGGWWLWLFPGMVLSATILSLQALSKLLRS